MNTSSMSTTDPWFFQRWPVVDPVFTAQQVVYSSVDYIRPLKAKLETIPIAGRLLQTPMLDSTLSYIQAKADPRRSIMSPSEASRLYASSSSSSISSDSQRKLVQEYQKLDKDLIDQAITMASIALETEAQSNFHEDEAADGAFELFLAAVAHLLHALPVETCDPLRREAFRAQLMTFLDDHDLSTAPLSNASTSQQHQHLPPASCYQRYHNQRRCQQQQRQQQQQQQAQPQSRQSFQDLIVSMAVQSAVALKQSPLPDMIGSLLRTSYATWVVIDDRYMVQEKTWRFTRRSVEKMIELDQQYSIHQAICGALFTIMTAVLKAGMAYNETPSYSDQRSSSSSSTHDCGCSHHHHNQQQQPQQQQQQPSSPSLPPQQQHRHHTFPTLRRRASSSFSASTTRSTTPEPDSAPPPYQENIKPQSSYFGALKSAIGMLLPRY